MVVVVVGQVPFLLDPIADEDKEDGDDSGRGRDEDEKGEVIHMWRLQPYHPLRSLWFLAFYANTV